MRLTEVIGRRVEMINLNCTRRDRERPKKTLMETKNKDLDILNLTIYMTFYIS